MALKIEGISQTRASFHVITRDTILGLQMELTQAALRRQEARLEGGGGLDALMIVARDALNTEETSVLKRIEEARR